MVHYGFVRKCHLYGASLLAQMLKILPAMQEALVQFPGSGRSPGEGNSNLLYCSCLENSKKKKKKRKFHEQTMGSQRDTYFIYEECRDSY